MKKLVIISFLFTALLSNNTRIYAQTADLYSFMEQYLTGDEKDQIARAKSTFEKGDKLQSQINEEDSKTDKYFAKKAKKGEKKSVEAKTLRIKQALFYEQAYVLIHSVYADKVGEGVFIYEEDEAKVNNLLEDASADNANAKKKMKDYKNVSPKDLKKEITYSKLKSDIQGMKNLYESGINKLIEAYNVIVDQDQKKQLEEEENRVWQNALSENTIYSFQNYLSEYPNGKYATEARSQIKELEEQAKKEIADSKNRSLTNLVFKVQIAASKTKLPDWKVRNIYRAVKEVEMMHYDEWYKYSVGKFKTYDEAKKAVAQTKVKGAFVVAYQDGKKIDIKVAKGE